MRAARAHARGTRRAYARCWMGHVDCSPGRKLERSAIAHEKPTSPFAHGVCNRRRGRARSRKCRQRTAVYGGVRRGEARLRADRTHDEARLQDRLPRRRRPRRARRLHARMHRRVPRREGRLPRRAAKLPDGMRAGLAERSCVPGQLRPGARRMRAGCGRRHEGVQERVSRRARSRCLCRRLRRGRADRPRGMSLGVLRVSRCVRRVARRRVPRLSHPGAPAPPGSRRLRSRRPRGAARSPPTCSRARRAGPLRCAGRTRAREGGSSRASR